MCKKDVYIKAIEIYHPQNKVDNSYFVNHFNQIGIDAESLMNHLGRKERYLASEDENSLSMAFKSAEAAINSSNTSREEIDMIVFVSDTPEYTVPTNALKLSDMLGTKNAHLIFDMNSNCTGMITALDVAGTYIKSNPSIRNALIAGSLHISSIVRNDCPISYPNIADGSASIILSCCSSLDYSARKGLIDAEYFSNPKNHSLMVHPACGMSKILDKNINESNKKLNWIPHDVSFFSDNWKDLIQRILTRNNLSPSDIDHYFFSQFSKPDVEATLDKLGVPHDRYTFVADKYGYTGCSSPFFAFYEALANRKICEGSKILFCSVGAGYTMSAALYIV